VSDEKAGLPQPAPSSDEKADEWQAGLNRAMIEFR
jgi:hypothetical protein